MVDRDTKSSAVTPPDLTSALASICSSAGFRRSLRLQRFLRYVVEYASSASDQPLKETQIARDVFDRRANFDPQIDPIVRVEAGRLRLRLTEYFAGPGQNDPILVEIARGGYLPTFRRQQRHGGVINRNDSAYRLYLKGRYFWDKRTAQSITRAAEYYHQALDADSRFALAEVGIADCQLVLATFEFLEPRGMVDKARTAAASVLGRGVFLAEAHATIGCIKAFYDREWDDAERHFELAENADPAYPTARQWQGMCACARGRLTDGLAALRTGAERDPLSLMANTQFACGQYMTRHYAEAEAACSLVLEMEPTFWPARYFRGLTYEQQGRFAQAVRDLQLAIDTCGGNSLPVGALAHVHAQAGGRRDAQGIVRRLQQEQSTYVSPWALALAYAGLGDAKTTLKLLDRAVAGRSPQTAIFLSTEPRLDSLRSDQRFRQLEANLYGNPGH
jgi:tetratricopeptide (TPR) repeat protein